jgi:hypothetical protein
MTEVVVEKLNQAVHECLSRCYAADDQLAALTDFLTGLRRNPNWTKAEIADLHTAVLRILRELSQPTV